MIKWELSREGMWSTQAPSSGKRHIGRRRAVPERREIGRKYGKQTRTDELHRTSLKQAKNIPRLFPRLAVALLGLPVDGAKGPLEWTTDVGIRRSSRDDENDAERHEGRGFAVHTRLVGGHARRAELLATDGKR